MAAAFTADDVVAAAKRLLAVCDGAVQRDDQGFNAADAARVRTLFAGLTLSPADIQEIAERLGKYRTQLGWSAEDVTRCLAVRPADPVTLLAAPHASTREVRFPFGKFMGQTLYDVASKRDGRSYLRWIGSIADFREPWRTYAQQALDGTPIDVTRSGAPPTGNDTDTQRATFKRATATTVSVQFPRAFKDDFKKVADGYSWDGASRTWRFPVAQLVRVVEFFTSVQVPVVLEGDLQTELVVAQTRKETLADLRALEDTDIDIPGLKLPLRNYQRVGVKFALAAGGVLDTDEQAIVASATADGGIRALVADEQGLGKTPTSIAIMLVRRQQFGDTYRIGVVVPKNVIIQWTEEWAKFTDLETCIWTTKGPEGNPDAPVHVTNYDALIPQEGRCPIVREWTLRGVQGLVCDEAHMLKTRDAQRTQAIMGSTTHDVRFPGLPARDIVFLTGTPILNHPREAFVLLHFIDPQRFKSWFHFANRYGAWTKSQARNSGGARPSLPQNLKELHERTKDVVIRRLQKDVQKELPALTVMEVKVDITDAQRKEYNQAFKRFLYDEDGNPRKLSAPDYHPLNSWLINAKLPSTIELLDELKAAGHTVLVFSTRLEPLHVLHQHFAGSVLIEGAMSSEQRQRSVRAIQGGTAWLGCLSLRAASVGLNLTAATRVVHLDLDWGPAMHDQAQKRAHRMGQVNPVVSMYMIAADTTDEDRLAANDEKRSISEQILDGKDWSGKRIPSAMELFIKRLRKRVRNLPVEFEDVPDQQLAA